jgi:hypothetical protein
VEAWLSLLRGRIDGTRRHEGTKAQRLGSDDDAVWRYYSSVVG